MPWAPPRPCTYPGCAELVPVGQGRCDRHRQERRRQQDDGRPSAAKRGYNARWRRYRKAFLSRNPLCRHCEEMGVVTAATVVDHIEPHKGDRKLFWDSGNHQPLCKPCHDRKTATEDGGFGRGGAV